MERILVSMDCRTGSHGALSRAISLAERIDAKLFALLVLPLCLHGDGMEQCNAARRTQERVEHLIEAARSEGFQIECFISDGDYEEEVVRLVEQNRITLVIAESPDERGLPSERYPAQIRRIRHRVSCRVELVSPRKVQMPKERRNQQR